MDIKATMKASSTIPSSKNESPEPVVLGQKYKDVSTRRDDLTSLEGRTLDIDLKTKIDIIDTQNSSQGLTTGRDFGN